MTPKLASFLSRSARTGVAFTPTLLACYAIAASIHLASMVLNTLLPFHVVRLGGSKTEVGLLFSVMTVISMFLRPVVGGWVDAVGVRPVLLPGVAALAATSLALHLATTPMGVIVLMAGVGLANGLISTTAAVLAAGSSSAAHRGEVLGVYYLASSLAIAVAPPLAFALLQLGGMPLSFVVVTGLAGAMTVLVWSLPGAATATVAGAPPGFRLWSRHALPSSATLVLTSIGHSSIYAFLPLYAVSRGQGKAIAWFFTVYPIWLIACRAVLRRLSDRVGRARVILPAIACLAGGFFALALDPTPASLVLSAILLATGGSVLYPTLAALVVDRAPAAERGLALGTLSASWDLGVVIGSALIGLVSDRVSYGAGFALAGITAALGIFAFLALEQRHARLVALQGPAGSMDSSTRAS
ncbi:MAG TPA: MFS transporter [Methylomirabilota bacterium]|nr:MFS transporter [Methylomirabilota bacterium]